MQLAHLGLPVTDLARSRRFYETYFGFDPATAQRYDDGTVIIRNRQRFDLALHPCAAVGAVPEFLHFGFRLDRRDDVRALKERVADDQVPVVEWDDEPELCSFKCLDPDGHRVEVYWEPAG
ncbi:VOC family protein [Actinoplanes sp. NBC_00393]|uniref:VOC family protein n=1 Tax=Actinoplanes sp. NBC_00393 TaxID=2975953 RepID=UPI002E240EC2